LKILAWPNKPVEATAPGVSGLGVSGSFMVSFPARLALPGAVPHLGRSPEPAFALPMTRASSRWTAGRTTTTAGQLAFIRAIRGIRGSFLACFSTTDYTDYTDGRGTGDSITAK
jgi:hypothetical protein